MPGGKFYTPSEGGIGGQVTATYSAGQEIDAEFVITAHHRGWLYLRLCDEARVTEACLEKYPPLERVRFEDDELIQAQPINPAAPHVFYLNPICYFGQTGNGGYGDGVTMKGRFKLPDGVSCEHCVLQMHWITANSCTPPFMKDFDEFKTNKWRSCSGDGGGGWYSSSFSDCVGTTYAEEFWNCADVSISPSSSSYSPTPVPAPVPVPAPTPTPDAQRTTPSPPQATYTPGFIEVQGTHYWDCNGAGCDSRTLQPWDQDKYKYASMYAPLNPANHGGTVYGEQMWLTGATSDALSAILGSDDGCCGSDPDGGGGCGRCLLVTNESARKPDWRAIVMKKNRCPPWSSGCGNGQLNLDVAVPGFDNLNFSTANICGAAGTTLSKAQSSTCGDWYNRGSSTMDGCDCSSLPAGPMRSGCELFREWGWTSGNPTLKIQSVPCPPAFVTLIGDAFDEKGVVGSDSFKHTSPSPPPTTDTAPTQPSPTPSSPPVTPISGAAEIIYERTSSWSSGFVSTFTPVPGVDISGRRLGITYAGAPIEDVEHIWNAEFDHLVESESGGGGTTTIFVDVIYNGFGFKARRRRGEEALIAVMDMATGACMIETCIGSAPSVPASSPPPPPPLPPPPSPPPPPSSYVPSSPPASPTTPSTSPPENNEDPSMDMMTQLYAYLNQPNENLDSATVATILQYMQTLMQNETASRVQIDGDHCVFPVDFLGQSYVDCVPYFGREWCVDAVGEWGECQV